MLASGGYRLSGMPFAQEQGIGAYLIIGLVLLSKGRAAFGRAWREWFAGGDSGDSGARRVQ